MMKRLKNMLFSAMLLLLAACMLFTGCGQKTTPPDNGDGTQNEDGAGNGGNNDDGNQNTEDAENGGEANESQGLESGLGSNGSRPIVDNYCGYRSDKTEFDIDDVTLEFFFGYPSYASQGDKREIYEDYFYICFINEADGSEIIVKKVEETLFSEKYEVIMDDDEPYKIERYNHSEMLTIPKELFINDKGRIKFRIKLDGRKNYPYATQLFCYRYVYYKVEGDKVVLSIKGLNKN